MHEQGRELPRRHFEPGGRPPGLGHRGSNVRTGEPIMVYRDAMQRLATVTLSAAVRAVAAGASGLAETSIPPSGEMPAAMGRAS
jgi:hypothetical protein